MTANFDQIRDQQRTTWDRFSAGWKDWDPTVRTWLAPVGDVMLRHADVGERAAILDVATGTGEPGLSAAQLTRGQVTLTDLAERMLELASQDAARRGLANVVTRVCDASALPFPDATFDAVLCRFGFMFFPDTTSAAREIARVTRIGGRFSAAVWAGPEKNPWATITMATIGRHVAMQAQPEAAPGLFRCASQGFLREVFAEAGFRDISEEEVACPLEHKSPEHYWKFMTDVAAPVVAGLALADDATQQAIRLEVLDQARRCSRDGRVQMRATAIVVAGTR